MNKRNNRKKLPKYWLGARRSSAIGYQPNYISGAQTSSTPGEDVNSETRAINANIIPGALNSLVQTAQPGIQTLSSVTPVTTALSGVQAINNAGGVSQLINRGFTPTVGGALNEAGLPTEIGLTKTSNVLNTAGKVAGILGTAYGAYNVGSQLAHMGDHRSAGDMERTMARNIETTGEGNQYETRGGVDLANELRYEHANRTAKQVNLTTSLAGLGFSAGSLTGNPLIAGIAAAGGLGVGGLLSLFGIGNNDDEIERLVSKTNEAYSSWGKQNEEEARNKDIKQRFSRSVHGANGLRPVYTPLGLKNGKQNAWLSHGETIVRPDGRSFTIPGKPDKKDTVPAKINSSDAILSNNGGSQYYQATGDLEGALAIDDNYRTMKKYCKGKLPFFKRGKLPRFEGGNPWLEYGLTQLPHLATMASNWEDYNRAKYADVSAPSTFVPRSNVGLNALAQLKFNANTYKNDALNAYRQAQWQANRMTNLGAGGKAALRNANFQSYLKSLSDINTKANEMNNQYLAQWANAKNADEAAQQQLRIQDNNNIVTRRQAANAAKEASMAQYKKNVLTAAGSAIGDIMKVYQYNRALGLQDKQLNLFGRSLNLDELRLLNQLRRPEV